MNRRWKYFVKDYLTFTRKDRIGLLILAIVLAGFIYLPSYLKKKPVLLDTTAFQQELAGLKITIDSSKSYTARKYNDDDDHSQFTPSSYYKNERPVKAELFAFDPNTLDAAGWKRLGLRDKTIATIQKFVGKGFTFRQPEDLKKIYGLRAEDADRLMPFVQIVPKENKYQPVYAANTAPTSITATPAAVRTPRVIDINEADSSAFISLPGIGSKLAARIINFRQKLGGFSSIKQVAETYALPDSTFQKIKEKLVCNNPQLKTIDINTADANQLKTHPYLRWNIAQAIVAYRLQHGMYKNVTDLKKIDIITDEVFDKVSPYLSVSK